MGPLTLEQQPLLYSVPPYEQSLNSPSPVDCGNTWAVLVTILPACRDFRTSMLACIHSTKVDLDGNGLISFAEFVMMMRKCKVDTDFDRQIREAFKVRGAGESERRVYSDDTLTSDLEREWNTYRCCKRYSAILMASSEMASHNSSLTDAKPLILSS